MVAMTKQKMEAELRRLAPFHHDVRLPHGLQTAPQESSRPRRKAPRVENLVAHAFPALLEACGGSLKGMRVLDLACSSGGFSVKASRLGAQYVLGIDIVDRYVEQAEFIKAALELENVEFRKFDVYDLDEGNVGRFDVTFCFGLLYHLENPVLAMRKVSAVTGRIMVVDTNTIITENEERALWHMNFPSSKSLTGNKRATTNLWRNRPYAQFRPNAIAVRHLLEFIGFDDVRRVEPKADNGREAYLRGERTTFLATRSKT
jgi:tRNA (mo5U34)-methyltransferase